MHPKNKMMLVDDNEADADLISIVMKKLGVEVEFLIARNYTEAMDAMKSETPPNIVILDLNLPGKNGMEVLKDIKGDTAIRSTIVIVLTSSCNPADIETAYANGANSYIRKKSGLKACSESMVNAIRYWRETAVIPEAQRQNSLGRSAPE